jgi:UDP:flavonoid glycosyltransferase YjiC (YdhE family)
MNSRHFLLITCPGQGHINPTLQLAKRLIQAGARVTFATTVRGHREIKAYPSLEGVSDASVSDGFDDGTKPTDDPTHIMSEFKRVGSQTLTKLILSLSNDHHGAVSFLIYSLLLPWAADVARDMGIPSALLCIQSAAAFAIYCHYFNSKDGMYEIYSSNPPSSIQLQGLPPLASTDLPSYLLPNSPHASVLPTFQEHIRTLEKDANPCVLLNTFDALEVEAIKTVDNMNLTTIGPLIPSAVFDGKDGHSDSSSVVCDLFEGSEDYLHWLSSKPTHSVVYVSFGSMVVMQRKQTEEILHGLVESGRPFMWVIRSSENIGREEADDMIKSKSREEEQGLIVPWCSQVEVLCHNSVGCFLTHCGWNSTLESMAAGVPVVACPHFSDQTTNAKLVEEVWGTGIKARVNEEGFVDREEIRKCVEMMMGGGEKGEEIRRNVKRWKSLAAQAVKEGGSSEEHLKLFLVD